MVQRRIQLHALARFCPCFSQLLRQLELQTGVAAKHATTTITVPRPSMPELRVIRREKSLTIPGAHARLGGFIKSFLLFFLDLPHSTMTRCRGRVVYTLFLIPGMMFYSSYLFSSFSLPPPRVTRSSRARSGNLHSFCRGMSHLSLPHYAPPPPTVRDASFSPRRPRFESKLGLGTRR